MDGGSKEYWAMCESMNQLYRVGEEERVLVKPFRRVKSMTTHGKETPANFSASSRGNTGGVSVIQIDWAYIACRWGSAALGSILQLMRRSCPKERVPLGRKEVERMARGDVISLDTSRNAQCEGASLDSNRHSDAKAWGSNHISHMSSPRRQRCSFPFTR